MYLYTTNSGGTVFVMSDLECFIFPNYFLFSVAHADCGKKKTPSITPSHVVYFLFKISLFYLFIYIKLQQKRTLTKIKSTMANNG